MDKLGAESPADDSLPIRVDCESLIRAGARAPSPDNNQPWAFEVSGPSIRVLHLREKAVLSDVRDLFSWLAIGASVENIVLAAGRSGLGASVEYHLPVEESGPGELVATVELGSDGQADPLAEWIEGRHTNRLPHSIEPLDAESLSGIGSAIRGGPTEILWVTERPAIKKLSKLVGTADRVRFEDRRFHDELHGMIRYTEEEVAHCRDGLDIRTLEIPRPLWSVLRFLRPWSRMRVANAFGASRSFSGISAKQARSTGALGLLVTSEDSDEGYLEAGRNLQRAWLCATAMGLAVHTLGSLPLFLLKLSTDETSFSARHARRLHAVRSDLLELLPDLAGHTPVMLFRLGKARREPTHRSVRYRLGDMTGGQ